MEKHTFLCKLECVLTVIISLKITQDLFQLEESSNVCSNCHHGVYSGGGTETLNVGGIPEKSCSRNSSQSSTRRSLRGGLSISGCGHRRFVAEMRMDRAPDITMRKYPVSKVTTVLLVGAMGSFLSISSRTMAAQKLSRQVMTHIITGNNK